MRVRLGNLSGRLVLDATGAILGRTRAPLVDLETWSIEALRVSLSRETAASLDLVWSFWKKRPTLDVPTGVVQAAGDAILLRVALAELHDVLPQLLAEPETPAIH
jgi:sporulation protein YlmC with PRC-barrel domain